MNFMRLRPAAQAFALLFLYTLITVVFFWPVITHFSTALIGPPENNLQDFWNLWYATHLKDYRHFFETDMIRFPDRISLIYHSFTYPHTLIIWLLTRITGASHATLTLMQNISLLLTFPLSGLGTYYLARHFSFSHVAAFVGGFIFAFNPWQIGQVLHHMGVCQSEFFPFFALSWLLTIEKKSYRWLVTAALLYTLAALCSWYNVFYMGFFIIFHAIYLRLRDDELPKGWRLAAPLMCFVIVAVLLSPLILPMMAHTSAKSYAGGANFYLVDLTGFFIFPPHHYLYPLTQKIFDSYAGNPWSATAYLGWINLLICGWHFWHLRRQKDPLRAYFLSGMIAFGLLAMGESLHVLGHDLTYIHLPHIIFNKLPFLANIRTPSRILVFVYMFLGLTVAYALTMAERKYPARAFAPALGCIFVLIVLDFWPIRMGMTSTVCSASLLQLNTSASTERYGILNLPQTYMEGNRALFWQTCHHQPIVYSEISRTLKSTLSDRIDPSKPQQLRQQLIRNKIKYILYATPRQFELGYQFTCNPKNKSMLYDGTSCRILRREYSGISAYEKTYRIISKNPDFTLMQVY